MTPAERKPVHWCTVHEAQWCGLAEQAREAWRRFADDSRESESLMVITSVDRDDPPHGAVYSETVDLEEAQRDLRRQVGAMKAAATRKANLK